MSDETWNTTDHITFGTTPYDYDYEDSLIHDIFAGRFGIKLPDLLSNTGDILHKVHSLYTLISKLNPMDEAQGQGKELNDYDREVLRLILRDRDLLNTHLPKLAASVTLFQEGIDPYAGLKKVQEREKKMKGSGMINLRHERKYPHWAAMAEALQREGNTTAHATALTHKKFIKWVGTQPNPNKLRVGLKTFRKNLYELSPALRAGRRKSTAKKSTRLNVSFDKVYDPSDHYGPR